MKRIAFTLLTASALLASCVNQEYGQDDVKRFFSKHKINKSPDYAVMKDGKDHLITIHGYVDDLGVCVELIKTIYMTPSLSGSPGVYTCVPLNH